MTHPLETIVAPATPVGKSALAMVRIDGPDSRKIISDLGCGTVLVERMATLERLTDGEDPIDEAIVVAYHAPRSYTGNDLVEVTLHGSPVLVGRLISAVIFRGARMAEPGEFTERAVLNGKLDLVQAEAVGDLISSRTALQARLSLAHLEGDLSRLALSVRERLLRLISRLEAALDFAEEGYEFITTEQARREVREAAQTMERLAKTYRRGKATNDGLIAVLLGRPNAGKSTMLNFLCGSDRAIVTAIPGTTRDLLRETIEIGGLPVTLVDTAGLRRDAEEIEEIGVQRAREASQSSDLVLYLIDASKGETDEDRHEIESLDDPLVVYTKTDLAEAPDGGLAVSITGEKGLESLLGELDRRVTEGFAVPEGTPAIVNERQSRAIEECREALEVAGEGLAAGLNEEIILVDLYRAANRLGVLVGAISQGEMIEEIFSKFCIGK